MKQQESATITKTTFNMEKVYLKVNEEGKTVNAFASIGMAICGIEQEAKRVKPEFITKQTLTKLVWTGRNGKEHSYEIMEAPIVSNVSLDYMEQVRPVTVEV